MNFFSGQAHRKALEAYVDACLLETPEEVARLFKSYTFLVWDLMLLGRIHSFYTDGIVLNYQGGITVQGVANVMADTLQAKRKLGLRLDHVFVDIFAQGSPDEGYSFVQATTYYDEAANDGKPYGHWGRMLPDGLTSTLCECRVEKVDGRWKIVQEWLACNYRE